ncbi:fungal zn(2)-Cys(6) binuclear cluster domain-containing protein [Hirsutella rhossiliensis]|uniref:Fungal zn(2)-Cys(6) binuclear cluster domain-containing protein n=1 Tax=Hirsutella rhossiliensis TaxID=111463 RepID=A0A9P8MS62_9HYPO|nr:fungal zn(2)-Cys(6) binuclear cluster domain-containing protein [Hirsutella rhossiliensis]KAH0960225.1 fungal zn(2)-Cys(6) binuclear cluster domain-containing protein [Hirsutella rhossiliensis]
MRSRPPPSRKKACQPCARSKARCGLEKPSCARCLAAGRQCRYAADVNYASPSSASGSYQEAQPAPGVETPASLSTAPDIFFPQPHPPASSRSATPAAAAAVVGHGLHVHTSTQGSAGEDLAGNPLDFADLDLAPLSDADQIRDRWLRPFLVVDQPPKTFHPHTLQYMSCVLRSYARQMMASDDRGVPPIIHPTQLRDRSIPVALANCYSLVRLWQHRADGSEVMVAETVRREMDQLAHHEHGAGRHLDILASFQAYLIYCIMAYFFPLRQPSIEVVDDDTMAVLQEMAFRTAQSGLICRAGLSRRCPNWESWIVAAAKGRALLAFYLFSNVYNAERLLPNFVAAELRDVAAPGAKRLWAAASRAEWEREYAEHLAVWHDGPFRISELWKSPETGSAARRERIDRWVQTVDEFGMMLFTICAHVHGC